MKVGLPKSRALFAPKPLIADDTALAIVVEAGVGRVFGGKAEGVACSLSGLVLGSVDELPLSVLVADGMARRTAKWGGSEPFAVSTVLGFEVGEDARDGPEGQRKEQRNLHRGKGN